MAAATVQEMSQFCRSSRCRKKVISAAANYATTMTALFSTTTMATPTPTRATTKTATTTTATITTSTTATGDAGSGMDGDYRPNPMIPDIACVDLRRNTSTTSKAPTIAVATNIEQQQHQHNDPDEALANALRPYYKNQCPVVLKGALQQYPTWSTALSCWRQRSYLKDRIGIDQQVDVEIGHYNNKGEKVTISFGQYVEYLNLFESMYGNKVVVDHDDDDSYVIGDSHKLQRNKGVDDFDDYDDFDDDDYDDNDSLKPQKKKEGDDDKEYNEIFLKTASSQVQKRPDMNQILYLAQNDLPPGLSSEVWIPRLCSDPTLGIGHGQPYQCMFWMGPPYAYSPFHYDPLQNLLLQVVGQKHVIVIDPNHAQLTAAGGNGDHINNKTNKSNTQQQQQHLYVGEKYGQQYNTSALDYNFQNGRIMNDSNQFPQAPLLHVVAQQVVLDPGDILFLPTKWWHSVRSLNFSISVNSWWR